MLRVDPYGLVNVGAVGVGGTSATASVDDVPMPELAVEHWQSSV